MGQQWFPQRLRSGQARGLGPLPDVLPGRYIRRGASAEQHGRGQCAGVRRGPARGERRGPIRPRDRWDEPTSQELSGCFATDAR